MCAHELQTSGHSRLRTSPAWTVICTRRNEQDGGRLVEVSVVNHERRATGPLMLTPVGAERRRSRMIQSIEPGEEAVVTIDDEARAVISVSIVSLYDPKRWRAADCEN